MDIQKWKSPQASKAEGHLKTLLGSNVESIKNPEKKQAKVSNFKRLDKNSLRGFFDLELPSGMILRSCSYHVKGDSQWIGWPAKPYVKEDGSKAWQNIIDFVDNKTKYILQDHVIPLVLQAMSEAGHD
jgi:hypothetical protein